MTPEDLQQAREFAKLFLPDQQGAKPPILVQAVVASVTNGVVSLYLSGEQAISIGGIRYLNSYQPTASDVVWCLKNGPDILVLGKLREVDEALQDIVANNLTIAGGISKTGTLNITATGALNVNSGGGVQFRGNGSGVAVVGGDSIFLNARPYPTSQHAGGFLSGGRYAYTGTTALASGSVLGPFGNFTFHSGRWYRSEVIINGYSPDGITVWQFSMQVGSGASWTQKYNAREDFGPSAFGKTATMSGLWQHSGSGLQFRVVMDRQAGTGNLNVQPLTPAPAIEFRIYDAGPTA